MYPAKTPRTQRKFFSLRTWRPLRLCARQAFLVYFASQDFKSLWLVFWQHLARGLSRSQAFIVTILFRNIASLIELAAFLAANNHGNGAFTDGDLAERFRVRHNNT